jgi:nucleoside-diphosphate-sugar epimerase
MRVAVTGAGGFLGTHLCTHLTARGHLVAALLGPDDTMTPPCGRSVRADITDTGALDAMMGGCDALVHAAGPPSAAASFADPAGFARTHVMGTAAAMHAANRAGIARRILVSSAEIYGAAGGTVDEKTPPAPISPYGAAKLGAEWMARTQKCDAVLSILRPFSLYGCGMRPTSVMGTILGQVRARLPVRLASLSPVRDYVHIGDFTQLVERTLTHAAPPLLLNVSSGVGLSVRDLARLALALAGRDDEPQSLSQPGGEGSRLIDVNALIGSNDAAWHSLDWRPATRLEDGLRALIAS